MKVTVKGKKAMVGLIVAALLLALRSHKTTTMITTAFRIDLMEPAMGMYALMSQKNTNYDQDQYHMN